MAHFSRLLREFQESVQREPLIPAGAPLSRSLLSRWPCRPCLRYCRESRGKLRRASYAIGLLVAAGLLAIVFVPTAVELFGRGFGANVHISLMAVGGLVLMTVFAPLLTGIVFRSIAPAFAERISQPCL